MSGTLRYQRQSLREALAAEYILGTLQGAARRRFVRLMEQDESLRLLVEEMSAQALELQQPLPEKAPPALVWRTIQYRLDNLPKTRTARTSLWDSLPFWRRLSTTAMLLLAVFVGNFSFHQYHSHQQQQVMMVVVNNDQQQPLWVIETPMDGKAGPIKVMTMNKVNMDKQMACAMWLQWEDGHVEHVANLPDDPGVMKLSLPRMDRKLSQAKVMVTMEPMDKVDDMEKPSMDHSLFADYWKIL
jgi:anti-sigma-K factor RskA